MAQNPFIEIDKEFEKRKQQSSRKHEPTWHSMCGAQSIRQIARTVDRVRNESAAKWEAERAHLMAQRDRAVQVLAERDAEHQQTLSLVDRFRNELADERERFRRELEQAMASQDNEDDSSVNIDALRAEVNRVETLIQEISRIIENPATELSVVIRRNAERIELESYLKGIRFSIPK